MTVPLKFAILAFQGFPMMAFSAVIEPLRAANTISSKKLYEWIIVGLDENPVVASNGIPISPHFSARIAPLVDYIVVCSGGDADKISAESPLVWIRKNLRNGAHVGSDADGARPLTESGIGYRFGGEAVSQAG